MSLLICILCGFFFSKLKSTGLVQEILQNHKALGMTTVHKRLKMVVSKLHMWI